MRTAKEGMKTINRVPAHSMDGAIAATVTMKTNPKLPRRATKESAEASASRALKTTGGLAEASTHGVAHHEPPGIQSMGVGHPER
jgi:hypothetical protein